MNSEQAMGPVILVDDEEHVRIAAQQTLELAGYDVRCFARAEDALDLLSRTWPGVVVSDIKMPQMDGMAFLRQIQAIDSELPTVLITGHGDIAMAVEAIRKGAYEFIEKPFPAEHLLEVLNRAMEKRSLVVENRSLRRELEATGAQTPHIIGKTPVIERMREIINNVADTDADVLIIGETGTGKELIARSLHHRSSRRDENFVALNCGAMPETIFESELFGHEPGSFTGAEKQRIGKLEHASGGTLFLDEIESMPLNLQVKLLRVLQERVVEPLGSNALRPVDLRVLAATKVDLKAASERGDFRSDLYYRLNVVVVRIPPLRERREDIPLLFQHFALLAGRRYGRETPPHAADTVAELMGHDWPGNVRELRNTAERFVLTGGVDVTDPGSDDPGGSAGADGLAEQVRIFEKSLIVQELARHKGNVKDTIDALGLPRKTFYDKLKKHGLERKDFS